MIATVACSSKSHDTTPPPPSASAVYQFFCELGLPLWKRLPKLVTPTTLKHGARKTAHMHSEHLLQA